MKLESMIDHQHHTDHITVHSKHLHTESGTSLYLETHGVQSDIMKLKCMCMQ